MTVLARQIPSVKNLQAMAIAEENKITLLYKVVDGICERSFGIHVAELAHFPQSVINMAKRKAAELEAFESDVADGPSKLSRYDTETVEKGLAQVNAFMDKMASTFTDAQDMTDDLFKQKAAELRAEFEPTFEENAWIKAEIIGR